MKRALLIAGGTLGGLGAVMAITPPQLSTTSSMSLSGAGAIGAGATDAPAATTSATPTAVATKKATTKPAATKKATTKPAATKKATPAATQSAQATATPTATATATPTKTATPAATKTTVAPAKSSSGTFVGPAIFVNYGTVQVQITVSNGKITDAKALQAPNGRSQRWTDMSVPTLRQQTLAAQSANIQGASGASYTSYGWYKSLQGALAKAGL